MEGLTRLVTESLARHGFDRPLDYRRLHWSRWFRCDSHHSLLFVPSKPGVFALAEEIMDIPPHGGADALVRPAEQSSAESASNRPSNPASSVWDRVSDPVRPSAARQALPASTPNQPRRMLAVTQFFEDDDMAFVLDRMLSRQNVMSSRLTSGRYFVRFVVVEDQTQRRSICAALNQWIVSSAEKATGIGSHFASSLELTPATEYISQTNEDQQSLFADSSQATNPHVGRTLLSANADTITNSGQAASPQLDSGAATNIHCPTPLPSGF